MTRVLHLSKTASGGRFIGYQLRYLAQAPFDIHLAVPGDGPLARMAREAGVTVHTAPALGEGLHSAGRQVQSLLGAVKPNLIHTHFVHSTLAARLGRRLSSAAPPIFFQVPGPLHLEQAWSRSLDIRTAGRLDHWGPACQWSFNRYLNSGVPADRVHLSYYGKSLGEHPPARAHSSRMRQRLGLPADRFLAVMVSHIYPPRRGRRHGIKGHEDFIRAIAVAQRSHPHIYGLVVGGPLPGAEAYFEKLQRLAQSVGADILFMGRRDDVYNIYTAADLAVHPSHSENLGGAGESLMMEVPTISTHVGGFPDVVRPGLTGLMVAPRRPAELAQTIVRATSMPVQMSQMAQQGRAAVEQVGDASANAARVRSVYEEILCRTSN